MATFLLGYTFARGATISLPSWDGLHSFLNGFSSDSAYWTGPLPDVVLAPRSSVRLWVSRTSGANPAFVIGNVIVTVSPNLPADQASIVQVEPLWLPVAVEPPTGAP